MQQGGSGRMAKVKAMDQRAFQKEAKVPDTGPVP